VVVDVGVGRVQVGLSVCLGVGLLRIIFKKMGGRETITLCIDWMCLGLAIIVYIHRIFGDFPAKNTVYTPYMYGSGQP
jgi:hypothetical protein